MNTASNMIRSKLTGRLRTLVDDVDLDSLCQVDPKRIEQNAVPHIGSIELVSGDDFKSLYDDLYVSMFPRDAEREQSSLVIDRLKQDFAGQRKGLAPFRVVGIRDQNGFAIGAAHFSVLRLSGSDYAVPYLQYVYVRSENRKQDMGTLLNMMVFAVAVADAKVVGKTVPFTLFETEPPNYGENEASRAVASQRIQIHIRGGGIALVLVRVRDGQLISAHVQPGLTEGATPLSLTWAVRASPAVGKVDDIESLGKDLVAGYYQSLRDEGFPEDNIRAAETIVESRYRGSEFKLVPLTDVSSLEGVSHYWLAK